MQIPSMNLPPPSLFAQNASNTGSAGFGSGYASRSMGRYGGYNNTLPPGTESGGGRSRPNYSSDESLVFIFYKNFERL